MKTREDALKLKNQQYSNSDYTAPAAMKQNINENDNCDIILRQ